VIQSAILELHFQLILLLYSFKHKDMDVARSSIIIWCRQPNIVA